MIKKLITGLIAGLALAVPGEARVESGTIPLLELLEQGGIALRYNSADCTSGVYLGLYRHCGMKRAMVLCPGASVDAEDHMVVRHEAITLFSTASILLAALLSTLLSSTMMMS